MSLEEGDIDKWQKIHAFGGFLYIITVAENASMKDRIEILEKVVPGSNSEYQFSKHSITLVGHWISPRR